MTVAIASTPITVPVSYSSPAAAALSVQSMPPTTVPRAKGITIGRYLSVCGQASSHSQRKAASHSVGQSAAAGSIAMWLASGIQPAHWPRNWMHPPTTSAASAPGILKGKGMWAVRLARMIPSDTRPASGEEKISSSGRNVIRARAIAVRLPSSAARGTSRRTGPATNAQAILKTPLATIEHMPMCQARRAAASWSIPPATASAKAGPITKNTIPNVLGVSSPSGIAVTSVRPVRRASRKAIQVKITSPTMTPTAVPGTRCERANWAG